MGDAVASFPFPGCETLWKETLAMTDFCPAALAHEQARNARPTYGLTLVADYPLSPGVLAGVERLRRVCQSVLGDRVELYADEHLHFTVYSLLRSRVVPLPDVELAAVWSRWLPRLEVLASEFSSLMVPLRGLSVTRSGAVLVCGVATDGLLHLQRQVARVPGVAAFRDIPPHITIGQVKRPCGTGEAFAEAMVALRHRATKPVGTLRATRLHVLYYGRRLLDQVIRSAVIPLGWKKQ